MNLTLEEEETMPTTGAELRAFRERADVKQQVLAQALSVNRTTLNQIENGFNTTALTPDLASRYVAEVRRIAREHAEAVGWNIASEDEDQADEHS